LIGAALKRPTRVSALRKFSELGAWRLLDSISLFGTALRRPTGASVLREFRVLPIARNPMQDVGLHPPYGSVAHAYFPILLPVFEPRPIRFFEFFAFEVAVRGHNEEKGRDSWLKEVV
jgi:hypothetical protein